MASVPRAQTGLSRDAKQSPRSSQPADHQASTHIHRPHQAVERCFGRQRVAQPCSAAVERWPEQSPPSGHSLPELQSLLWGMTYRNASGERASYGSSLSDRRLPTPGAPTSVTSRSRPHSTVSSAASASRPKNRDSGIGKLPRSLPGTPSPPPLSPPTVSSRLRPATAGRSRSGRLGPTMASFSQEIERRAGERFRDVGMSEIAAADPGSVESLAADAAARPVLGGAPSASGCWPSTRSAPSSGPFESPRQTTLRPGGPCAAGLRRVMREVPCGGVDLSARWGDVR